MTLEDGVDCSEDTLGEPAGGDDVVHPADMIAHNAASASIENIV
jgi:hypothetical protein